MKRIISTIVSVLSALSLFAGGANESRLFYLPRNVANNNNVMIELTEAKSLSTIDAGYSNTSTNNLSIFRLRDSLLNRDQPSNSVTVTISSNNGWYFVNENNPTSRVGFEMNCILTERKNVNRGYDTNVSQQLLSGNTTLTQSGAVSSWTKVGDSYTLTLPMTSFNSDAASYYADYIREADINVVIPEDTSGLESGYYTTTIYITTTEYQEHKEKRSLWGIAASLEKDGGVKTFTETITLRGYVGIDPGEEGIYSFTVSSAADSYSMDLGITTQSTPYDVARISFTYTDMVDTQPNENTQANKFAIYISPTSIYSSTGIYRFIKMGSEYQARTSNNTIDYDLYARSNTGYKKLGSSANWSDTVASISAPDSLAPNTYKAIPKYEYSKISEAGWLGGETEYKETWNLDLELYLKLTSDSLSSKRDSGLYYSYIYVTLVAN